MHAATAGGVLVVDDLRIFTFDAVYARTSGEALRLLQSQPWAELWLDHDLGGYDTVVPVLDRMCELAFERTPVDVGLVIIHSSNPAARRLLPVLERYGYRARGLGAAPWLAGTLPTPA